MVYLLVDLENIAPGSLAGIPDDWSVYVFAGDHQGKLDMDLAESMLDHGGGAKIVRAKGHGKNALDFHIAYYIGKLSEKDPGSSFRILSKDKGFDPLVGYLKGNGIACARIEGVADIETTPGKGRAKPPCVPGVESFAAHLKGISEKARPKKEAKLKAYIQHWAKQEESWVEPIFKGLLSKGLIRIEGNKVEYSG